MYGKAVDILQKRFPKFDFLIIGDGMYKDTMAKKAQKKLEKSRRKELEK